MRRRRSQRPPKESVIAQIDHFSHDCRGIARIDGKTVFIQGALPGEEVEFQYTRVKKDFSEGKVLRVIKPSPSRVEPQCPHFELCGGCSLQFLAQNDQIQMKEDILMDLFARVGHLEPENSLPPLQADAWNYRNKARLSVRFVEKKNATLVGFRERDNPRFITDIGQCPVLNAKVDADIGHLRALLDSLDDKQSIAQIEVAAGDEEVALIFRHLNPLSPDDQEKLRDFSERHAYLIYLQPGGEDSVHLFHPQRESEFLSYALPDHQLQLYFHPCDFTQVNAPLNRLMINKAIELMDLQPQDEILDLFCGLGNFSLPMAKKCAKVIGIEGSQAMVERAFMNARKNQIDQVEFFAANLDDPQQIQTTIKGHFNKLLIDPPRSGALEIVKAMGKWMPERIVYVSCNPVTLARDADILVHQHGYHLNAAGVMDMFPNTTHVESIALFTKG